MVVSKDLSNGPLTGLKVIDMTVAIQGPHVGAFLSDMGAEVIKVEPPGGELNRYARGPGFDYGMEVMGSQQVAMNRGKKSIALDAHTDLGKRVLNELIKKSDVFVSATPPQILRDSFWMISSECKTNPLPLSNGPP